MTDRILLRGMQFYAYHGVHTEEQRLGQRFAVDLEAELDLTEAGRTDGLDATVNYGALYQTVRAIVEGEPRRLLEAVAQAIADRVLAEHPAIQSVTVRVWKLAPPIAGGILERVGVEIRRQRIH
ncbi:MAG: dihydroneopterin aldolase [Thermomicrobium sp.]|nr:dihydroneopterin aldolase [Thermomicrobium sp.]